MIKKQVSSLLFNKKRTVNNPVNTENLPELTLTDLKQPSTDTNTKPQDLTNQTPGLSTKTTESYVPESYQNAIEKAKEVLRKGKDLLSELNK